MPAQGVFFVAVVAGTKSEDVIAVLQRIDGKVVMLR